MEVHAIFRQMINWQFTVNILIREKIYNAMPRSKAYQNKIMQNDDFINIKKTWYFKRGFLDGSVELTRYDAEAGKWIFLLFAS